MSQGRDTAQTYYDQGRRDQAAGRAIPPASLPSTDYGLTTPGQPAHFYGLGVSDQQSGQPPRMITEAEVTGGGPPPLPVPGLPPPVPGLPPPGLPGAGTWRLSKRNGDYVLWSGVTRDSLITVGPSVDGQTVYIEGQPYASRSVYQVISAGNPGVPVTPGDTATLLAGAASQYPATIRDRLATLAPGLGDRMVLSYALVEQATVGVPPPGTPPPGGPPVDGNAYYQMGYQDGYAGQPPRTDFGDLRTAPVGSAGGYYWQGYQAGYAARQQQPLAPPTGNLQLDPRFGYEVFATLPIIGGEPFNIVQAADNVLPVARYYLLGGRPGDEQRGFKLSGPRGEILYLAQQLYPGQSPMQVLGLPAWVGTIVWEPGMGGRHVAFMSAETLQSLPLQGQGGAGNAGGIV